MYLARKSLSLVGNSEIMHIEWTSNGKCVSSEGWHEQWVKVPSG